MSDRRMRLILVDNDRKDYEITRMTVGRIVGQGYDLDWESDPEAALAAIGSGRYDAALIDYRLGADDGLRLVRQAIAEGYDGPLIVLTGWGNPEIDAAALEAGAADFLDKGELTPRSLDRTLRYAIRQRETERQLRRARAESEAAGQAKDRFLAVLSHELRTPLTPILVAASTALEGDLPAPTRSIFEMVIRNIKLEARLVDDLLDVSRIGRGELTLSPEAADVHHLVRQAAEICRDDCRAAGLYLIFNFHAERSYARVDPSRLTQACWNLIQNAARYSVGGGTLEIISRDLPEGTGGQTRLVVEFRDDGIGLEPDQTERIFEPFERGAIGPAGRGSGLGLGLSIARAVLAAHGGSLDATSPGRGCGSTFRLELPAVEAPRPSPMVPKANLHDAGGLCILLVEDNADTRHFFTLALRSYGHEVIEAASVGLAREMAGRPIDLLLSDIELPDGTGHELMRELAMRGIKGISMSGFGSDEDIRESRDAGFAEHLTKPLLIAQVAEAIRRHAPAGPRSVGCRSGC